MCPWRSLKVSMNLWLRRRIGDGQSKLNLINYRLAYAKKSVAAEMALVAREEEKWA